MAHAGTMEEQLSTRCLQHQHSYGGDLCNDDRGDLGYITMLLPLPHLHATGPRT